MKLQKFPILTVAILGILSVGMTDLWAFGGGGVCARGGGGGIGFQGGGVRVSAFPASRGVVVVQTPAGTKVLTGGRTGIVGAGRFDRSRCNRFDRLGNLNNAVIGGGGYVGGYPYYPNPPYYDPNAANNAYPAPAVAESTAPPAPQSPGLVAGDVVGNVQRVLKYKGFYHGPIDGLSGPTTRAAIRAYDASVGLPPTGIIDARLLISMQLM